MACDYLYLENGKISWSLPWATY